MQMFIRSQLHVQSPISVSNKPADYSKNSRAAAHLTRFKTQAPPAARYSLMQCEIIAVFALGFKFRDL